MAGNVQLLVEYGVLALCWTKQVRDQGINNHYGICATGISSMAAVLVGTNTKASAISKPAASVAGRPCDRRDASIAAMLSARMTSILPTQVGSSGASC